jgi:hypothetical protein
MIKLKDILQIKNLDELISNLEEKKKKILADRKAKLEAKKVQDSILKAKKNNN